MNGDRASNQVYMAQALSLVLEKRGVPPITGSADYVGASKQKAF